MTELVKSATDPRLRHAGLLTLHLVGIGGTVAGRFTEDFTNRTAREALWKLLAVEGLTDEVADLLKRDPWPADVPAIMDALAQVKGDCPRTLNALARYPIPPGRRPFDNLGQTGWGGVTVRFTIPKTYTEREYARVAIEGIKEAFPGRVEVEEGLLDQIPVDSTAGNDRAREWTGSLDELLASIKDRRPPFDYTSPGRGVYYFGEGVQYDEDRPSSLHFCSAHTAKKRLLAWWQSTGRSWYCY